MDTKFWGPDCWNLLHCITQNYPESPSEYSKKNYKAFFNSLRKILPCKYCRNSTKIFMTEININDYLDSKQNLCKWLFLIHNKVNDKLRNQGKPVKKNPSFSVINSRYKKKLNHYNNNPRIIPGIDFLYSVVFNYTFSIDYKDKICHKEYINFFKTLKNVIPFKIFKKVYKEHLNKYPISKNICDSVFKLWIFALQKSFKRKFNDKLCYDCVCKKYAQYRAKCSINTCKLLK